MTEATIKKAAKGAQEGASSVAQGGAVNDAKQ
jgi:hypothetical protein